MPVIPLVFASPEAPGSSNNTVKNALAIRLMENRGNKLVGLKFVCIVIPSVPLLLLSQLPQMHAPV
ncbi:MAG: hypothetical protein OHK0029_18620 [Armatimonadaceae bacterium]